MATEFDLDLSSDPTSLASNNAATLANSMTTLLPDAKHGGVYYGSTEPDVTNNPRYVRYLRVYAPDSVTKPVVQVYNPVTEEWENASIADLSITNTMLAGGITLDKILASGTPGFILRISSSGQSVELKDIADALTTVALNKLDVSGAGAGSFLKIPSAGGTATFEVLTAAMMPSDINGNKLLDASIIAGKYASKSIDNDDIADAAAIAQSKLAGSYTRGLFSQYQIGILVNRQVTESSAVHTASAAGLVMDNSIPQYDGTEVGDFDVAFESTYTPKKVGNALRVTCVLQAAISGVSTKYGVLCLAVDTTLNVLATSIIAFIDSADGDIGTHIISYETTVASLTARTYKVVAGSQASTNLRLNTDVNGTVLFGGTMKSQIIIEEFETP